LLDKLDPHHTLSIDQAIEAGKQASSRDRHQVRARLEAAMQQQTELLILYHSTQESTQRRIRVEHINNKEVHAWCFLRQDRRVFRLDRIEILTE
jgi:predicted DNA-binding transcriptional regulator YafY